MSRYGRSWYPEYVPVAERRAKAQKLVEKLQKKGQILNPIVIEGRTIAKTFWGKSWCLNLESFSDYDSRLPRGRTYARNGSVIDLKINPGEIIAMVTESEIYTISIKVSALSEKHWKTLVKECSGGIESLIELLQGKFSKGVMEIMSREEKGMFPKPKEITLDCSCPDYASMCKHVAAVLYGVGHRLDENPEDLFTLRQVNPIDLLNNDQLGRLPVEEGEIQLDTDLSALFGIEIADKMQTNQKKYPSLKSQVQVISPKVIKKKIIKKKKILTD